MKFTPVLIAGCVASTGVTAVGSRTVTLAVTTMDSAVCPITVRKALEKVPGVETATGDFKTKRAVVAFDPAKTSPEALTRTTTCAGFSPSVKQA